MAIGSLLIANRGEIAVRIIRAARLLGIRTVQAHSAADADSLAVRMADEAVLIGPPPAAKSYLDIGAVMKAAREAGVDAVHPGYGFLAENPDFADAVVSAGMIFVGPDARQSVSWVTRWPRAGWRARRACRPFPVAKGVSPALKRRAPWSERSAFQS